MAAQQIALPYKSFHSLAIPYLHDGNIVPTLEPFGRNTAHTGAIRSYARW